MYQFSRYPMLTSFVWSKWNIVGNLNCNQTLLDLPKRNSKGVSLSLLLKTAKLDQKFWASEILFGVLVITELFVIYLDEQLNIKSTECECPRASSNLVMRPPSLFTECTI